MKPRLILLAGPNGAGKSTFYEAHLSHLSLPFLNADVLARHVHIDSYSAAKQVASLRDYYIKERCSFITETVFSDPVGEKVRILGTAVEEGFTVDLIYIGIDSPLQSKDRVATRVSAGGHDVPEEKLEGRYFRSLENLKRAIDTLPRVLVYDNSSSEAPHRFVAEFRDGTMFRQADEKPPHWFPPQGN